MSSLSVAIIARDEERHIGGCLHSIAGLADEIVVLLDNRTTDATASICRAYGAIVHLVPWRGFPAQRNLALQICTGEWVLFIDADEQLTPELAGEIHELLAANPSQAGFWIPRTNLFFGQPLRGGGWYPDYQLRLVRRTAAAYEPERLVHEYAILTGPAGYLEQQLLHHNIEQVDELWRKQREYALVEAQTLFLQGQRTRWRNFLARPLREFGRRYLQLGGWRDGRLGLALCLTMAWFELIKFVHLKGVAAALAGIAQADRNKQPMPAPVGAWPVSSDNYNTTHDIAVVIVSWNVRDLLRQCVASLLESLATSKYRFRIVVVDNASHDGSAEMLRTEFPGVEVIEPGTNLGFSAGNNLALRIIGSSARYLLLLNPDTKVVGDAVSHLATYLDDHPTVDVVGPQLRYPDGSIQSSRRRFPTRASFFWESTLLEQWWPSNPWTQHYRCADQPADQTQLVEWLVGAALLVRASAIRRAGLLDEGFFMYSEELEWQWRIQGGRQSGCCCIVYLPSAQIVHYEGRSSEQVSLQRHLRFQHSKLRLAKMRYGPTFAQVLRLFLLLGYTIQLLVEAAKWSLGHRRSLRRERIRLYRDLLQNFLPVDHQ